MKTYIAHNMDENEEFLAGLEMTRSEAIALWKLTEKGVCLLRKVEKEKKTF